MTLYWRLAAFCQSFRFRLLVLFTLLTAVMTAAFTFFYVSHESSTYRYQLQREAKLLAEQLAQSARLPLFAEDRPALNYLLSELSRRYPVKSAMIVEASGTPLASTGSRYANNAGEGIAYACDVLAGSSDPAPQSLLGGDAAGQAQRPLGRVLLVLETRELHDRLRQLITVSVTISLIFWLLVSTVGYLFLQRMTRSFNLLMAGIKVIEQGNLTNRIPAESSDEPGRAATAINALAATLLRREAENQTLQQERDAALRLEVQEEKKRIMARLIQTNKMTSLGLLVSSMAHEINNPNATIALSAHYLAMAWQDARPLLKGLTEEEGDFCLGKLPFSMAEEEFGNCVATIQVNTARIAQVIQDLRSYGLGMKSGGFTPGLDVNRVVSAALTIVRCYNKSADANLRFERGNDLPLLTGNQPQLEQVIINLLMNALQALPDSGGTVVIATTASDDGREVIISVRDNGVGMPQAVRERLFEAFFSTKMEQGGSGLGLYIANFIITEHQGRLEFDSSPGEGTTAAIRLPVE